MTTKATPASIGRSPLAHTVLRYFAGAMIPVMMMMTGTTGGVIVGGVLVFVLGIPFLVKFARAFGRARTGRRHYRAAAKAVSQNLIHPSFVGRGDDCMGLAMVSESARKVYVNGCVYDYTDIEDIEVGPFGADLIYVDFLLRTGSEPTQRVIFDDDSAAKNFVQRLRNAMRTPAPAAA